MQPGTRPQNELCVVPLRSAFLCVDCECVTGGRYDECRVCGSRSLLSLANIVGGSQFCSTTNHSEKSSRIARYDVGIAVDLEHVEPRDLNAAVEGIIRLIGPWLVQGRASCHIDVDPVVIRRELSEPKAAAEPKAA